MTDDKEAYIVYFREGCHLCVDFVEDLLPLIEEFPGAEFELQDIDKHPDIKPVYDSKVPVLVHNGQVLCEYFLDYETVREHLMGNSRAVRYD